MNELTDSQIDALRALAISDIKSNTIGNSPHNGTDNIKVIKRQFCINKYLTCRML